jgi:hypothetical protein
VVRLLVLAAMALPAAPAQPHPQPDKPRAAAFQASVAPLSPTVRATLRKDGYWHKGCPVPLSGLRVLRVNYKGFDGRRHTGRIVVNAAAAQPLARVFRKLYALHFPIRRMGVEPVGSDTTASFSCRQAVPSPCTKGRTGTGSWSMHAYGLAVDLNPRENPYVGCGQSRDPKTRPYFDRTRHRKGMVTGRAVAAFASVGWGWGGAWASNTKDHMHFSSTGH